jgi:hypothetical protein
MASKLKPEEEFFSDEISFGAGGDEVQEAWGGAWIVAGFLLFLAICAVGAAFAFV